MLRIITAMLASVAIICLLVPVVLADEILLRNGDLISGEIVRLEGESITINTSYAGEIKVKWQEVICVTTDEELTFTLKNKEILKGKAICPDDGKIQIEGEKIGRSQELALAELEGIYLKPPPAVKYNGSITVGGSANRGNTDKGTLNSAARFVARAERSRLFLDGRFRWGESDGVRDEQNWLLRGKYDYFFKKKWYAYAQTLLENDDFQDLNLRTTAGAGVGHQFFDTDRTKLFLEAGPSYVTQDYADAEDNDFVSARWATGFDFDIVPKKLKLFHQGEGYFSLEDSDDWFLLTAQGLRATIVGSLFANFEFDYSYNNKPPPDIKKSDYAVIVGLGYDFGN